MSERVSDIQSSESGNDQESARKLILVLGGARGGKSALAERLASRIAGSRPVLYVATATAGDDEMHERIALHQRRRPANWRTLEEPIELATAIPPAASGVAVVLIDCVTLWVSNLLFSLVGDAESLTPAQEAAALARVDLLVAAYRASEGTWIFVSNEVGLGLVPPYPLGRVYRDLLGRVNQRLAAAADQVLFTIAGLPIDIKALSATLGPDYALPSFGDLNERERDAN